MHVTGDVQNKSQHIAAGSAPAGLHAMEYFGLVCSFSLVSLSIMHEVVGEVILPNTFFKTAQLHLESHSGSYFLKTHSFTSEVELCQTSPLYIYIYILSDVD
jgi:hypothetical protein